jgi:putative methyltransferase (TIGR04325 family)
MRQQLEQILPHFVLDWYYEYIKKSGWFGDYPNWESARRACKGYDDNAIFEQVCAAVNAVRRGEAAYERDAVLFKQPAFDKNIIQIFFEVANASQGKLHILDFGGSLGSTFYQYSRFLQGIDLQWCVVEQTHFVEYGRKHLTENNLFFEYEILDAIHKIQPNLVLLSSVLQYLEHPYEWLNRFAATQIPYLLIDLQPVTDKPTDRITRQIVPPSIYSASYPCHLLSEALLKNKLFKHYDLLKEFPAWDKAGYNCYYKGYFLKQKI